jgi:GrpB-like predicted nucleotidyltransferase (UPF0157 family)
VTPLDPARFVGPLEALGYLYAPDPDAGDRHFFARPHARPRTHHVHVCPAGGDDELRHLAVRDFLRAHPAEAHAYGEHKMAVAARHPEDRIAYIDGKKDFIAALEVRALTWSRESHLRQI